jgi:uncharacterized membrane protein
MTAPELALSKDPPVSLSESLETPPLTIACRALLLLFGIGLSVGFAVGFLLLKDPLVAYLTNNDMRPAIRRFVLGMGFGTAALLDLGVFVAAFSSRRAAPMAGTLHRVSHRLAPLGVTGFLPFLFQWKAWGGRDVEFLTLVVLASLVLEVGVRSRRATEPTRAEKYVHAAIRRRWSDLAARFPRALHRAPLLVTCAAALAYAAYFSYVTIAWHYSVRSGSEVALENNLLWNLVHGGQVFKASSQLGPAGSRLGSETSFLALAVAPVYALHQRPETLYVLQAVLLGAAALPLFVYARRYLGGAAACLLALLYLLSPGVHGANLFEFHYLPLSIGLVWLALYALETRRNVLAAVAIALSLAASQSVALELIAFGIYLLVTGKRPHAGLVVASVAVAYFVVLQVFVVRPAHGAESVGALYQRLLPAGEGGLGSVMGTVVANPSYTLGTLLDTDKLVYAMQMLVPLALVPWRRPLGVLLAAPAVALTTLSSLPTTWSIHNQHNAYWVTSAFVAAVLVLSSRGEVLRRAALWAMTLATLATSYQYGAVMQHHTSACGPIPFKFGVDHEGRIRHAALVDITKGLLPRAKVAASAFTTSQVSSRPVAYSLAAGVLDAEYVLFPSSRADFVGNEYDTVTTLLHNGSFGVVSIAPPFALARRGENPSRNDEVLGLLR